MLLESFFEKGERPNDETAEDSKTKEIGRKYTIMFMAVFSSSETVNKFFPSLCILTLSKLSIIYFKI